MVVSRPIFRYQEVMGNRRENTLCTFAVCRYRCELIHANSGTCATGVRRGLGAFPGLEVGLCSGRCEEQQGSRELLAGHRAGNR